MDAPVTFELFASDEQLEELEARYALDPETMALPLAWALRERDPGWALSLALEAELPPALEPRRVLLQAWLFTGQGRHDEAQALGDQAEAAFEAAGDALGLADARLLAAQIITSRSMLVDNGPALLQAIAHAERADDPVRMAFCKAMRAGFDMLKVGLETAQAAAALLPAPGSAMHAAVASQVALYHGLRMVREGDYRGCVPFFVEAYEQAISSGQAWQAGTMANNLALTFAELGELAQALEWGQAMMAVARKAWPNLLGQSLSTNTTLLVSAGQFKEAREMANECLQHEFGRPTARAVVSVLEQLGLIELASGNAEAALANFEAALRRPGLWPAMRFQIQFRHAETLLKLGRLEPALKALQVCLDAGEQDCTPVDRLLVRAMQADIWLGQGQTEQALRVYQAVLEESAQLAGFTASAGFYVAAAKAHAAAGLHERAYELSRRALEQTEQRHSHQAEQRSRALYAQFRTERNRIEAEHQRGLVSVANDRLAVLERNHAVLDQLGAIGRELTAQLDTAQVLAVLARHVRTLLPADCLIVHLLDASGEVLECALCEQHGQPLSAPSLRLDNAESLAVRCARERQVLVLQDQASQGVGVPVEGMALMRSRVFAPLLSGSTLVGVMSLQSAQAAAFGPEPQLIFATLCAYAAIALDNARAYRQLGQMQQQLRAQERLAALGSMVAGLSHELNTPLGNALLAVSTMQDHGGAFALRLQEGALRRSDWQGHADALGQGIALARANLETALGLVNQFRQIAQRRDSQQRRRFELAELCPQSLALLSAQAARGGHAIEIEIAPALEVDSDAHAIAQALDILVGNALVHGLSDGRPGRVRVQAERVDGALCRIVVSDDGRGMSSEVLARAFEPFFTTTFGKGGNGLGLTICHTLVQDVLGGRIEAFSKPGKGSRFVMELPLTAPD